MNIKTKLLMLAGMSTVFSGMAFAQLTCAAPATTAVFIRQEGKTEQVGDTLLTCTNGATPVASGQTLSLTIYLSPSVTITSANVGSGSTIKSETIAGIGTTGTGLAASVAGIVSGNSVTFTGIVLPNIAAAGTINIAATNIKIDATSLPSTGAPTGLTETIFISGSGATPSVVTPAPTVAYATSGITSIKANNAAASGTSLTNIAICTGSVVFGTSINAAGGVTTTASGTYGAFSVIFNEGFTDALKLRGSSGSNTHVGDQIANHTETGFGVAGSPSGNNTATTATRVKFVVNNIPTGATLWVPVVLNAATGGSALGGNGVLTLTNSETGAYSAVAASSANGAPDASSATVSGAGTVYTPLTVSSGSSTLIYEVTTADTNGNPSSFTLPVLIQSAAGAVTSPSTGITVTVSLAPIGASSNVPNFVSGASTTTVTGPAFQACSTTLLFPYVTAGSGFDTGLAITNTSNDLLGTKNGAAVTAAANQAGTCNLTFFGTGAPATQPPATSTIAAGGNYSALLSSLAPGFTGYMIANCNFLYAHGFAFIVYNFGTTSGTTMGYLADAIATGRTVGTVSTVVPTFTAGALTALANGTATNTASSSNPEQ